MHEASIKQEMTYHKNDPWLHVGTEEWSLLPEREKRKHKKSLWKTLKQHEYGNRSAQQHIKHRCITIWYHHSIVLQGKWTLLLIELLLTFFHFTFHHISCDMGGWRSALCILCDSDVLPLLSATVFMEVCYSVSLSFHRDPFVQPHHDNVCVCVCV